MHAESVQGVSLAKQPIHFAVSNDFTVLLSVVLLT